MSSGRINSPESLRTAAQVVRAFGGWEAVEAASHLSEDGVRRIMRSDLERAQRDRRDRAE